MKKSIFSLLVCPLLLFTNCGDPQEAPDKLYPVIDKIDAPGYIRGYANIRLYVIDSCEYIGAISGQSHDFLSHKGNCRFCIERSKK